MNSAVQVRHRSYRFHATFLLLVVIAVMGMVLSDWSAVRAQSEPSSDSRAVNQSIPVPEGEAVETKERQPIADKFAVLNVTCSAAMSEQNEGPIALVRPGFGGFASWGSNYNTSQSGVTGGGSASLPGFLTSITARAGNAESGSVNYTAPFFEDLPDVAPAPSRMAYSAAYSLRADSGSCSHSYDVALFYVKPTLTTATTGPVGPGDEITYTYTTPSYPHAPTERTQLTISSPTNTRLVAGSITGIQGARIVSQSNFGATFEWLGPPQSQQVVYRVKVDASVPLTVTELANRDSSSGRYFIEARSIFDQHSDPNSGAINDLVQWSISIPTPSMPVRPNLILELLPERNVVEVGNEIIVKARFTNVTDRAFTNVLLDPTSLEYSTEGLLELVTPTPAGVALAPGASAELDYRFTAIQAGKVKVSGQGAGSHSGGSVRSHRSTSAEICVGCSEVELTIEVGRTNYKVGEQFPVNVTVLSRRNDTVRVTFDDPVLKERPEDDIPANSILTLESPNLPPPFELTPTNRSRTFTAVAEMNRLGVTDLVSSLSWVVGSGQPTNVTKSKKIQASLLEVSVQVTPKQAKLNDTPAAKKSERCRQIEATSSSYKNCIEFVATMKNTTSKPITSVSIPGTDNFLSLINGTNPKLLGEPLIEIERTGPAGNSITLQPGEEATWIWRANAFGAPAALKFEPTAFGVYDGVEVGGSASQKFVIIDKVLLEWGMRPTDGRTSYKSGDLVRADGYIENVSAANGGEGKDLLVHVYAIHKRNIGGGWVAPLGQGLTATQEHFFNLPHEEGVRIRTVESVFRSIRAGIATRGEVEFGVRMWVINKDGSITDAGGLTELNDDGYKDGFEVFYSAEQMITDPYLQECLNADVPVELCGFSEKFYGDFLPGLVGLGEFAWDGAVYLAEASARSEAMRSKSDAIMIAAVLEDKEATDALMQSLHADYVALHQQGVLAGHVVGSLPMTLQEFSNQTLDGFGRYLHTLETGDLTAIRLQTAQFFGSNPDLILEPLMMLRGLSKLRGAMSSLRQGTADNIYAAAVQTSARSQAADLDARIAAKKAEGGDPDLAKALLPGDRLTARLLIEVFGVDQDTVRRIQDIANDAGVVLAFRARSARASQLLKDGLAWAKPQALKQKCVNKLDIDYLGYDPAAYGRIEIVEPPASLRGLEGEALETAVDAHMVRLLENKPELRGDAGKELRAEVRDRIKTRAEEWNKYTPKLELDNPDRLRVSTKVNFEAPMQWAHDRVTDIGPGEKRNIYRNQRASRIDPATGEPVRTWEITMDGPGGQEPRWVTGDIDFLGILDQNGAFINDKDKRIAIYKALSEAQLMEHGESMSFRLEKARIEYLECCLLGSGEGMLTVGPWGGPRVGFFVDNRSVIQEANAAFKRVRRTEVARKPSGEVIYENGQPKTIVIRMENPTGEFLLYTGSPTLNFIDEAVERVFTPLLWKTVWQNFFETNVKLFFPRLLKDFIEDETQNSLKSGTTTDAIYTRGGPIVRFEPSSLVEFRETETLQMWTSTTGWTAATREQVVAEGQPGAIDFAPYSVLRENSSAGADKLTIAALTEMGAIGDFFAAGDWVVLDPGGENQEIAMIVNASPLTFAAPLQNDHNVGEMIAWIEAPAALATVSGQVKTANGRGISSAFVTITDLDGVARTTKTNAFGNFKIADVAPGSGYILEVSARRYQFAPRNISVSGDLSGLEIIPIE